MTFGEKLPIAIGLILALVGGVFLAFQVSIHHPPSFEKCMSQHPDWSEQTCRDVSEGTIRMGMTEEQVLASRGKPDDINQTVTEYGTREQWVYGEAPYTKYLYFENGVLTSWQT